MTESWEKKQSHFFVFVFLRLGKRKWSTISLELKRENYPSSILGGGGDCAVTHTASWLLPFLRKARRDPALYLHGLFLSPALVGLAIHSFICPSPPLPPTSFLLSLPLSVVLSSEQPGSLPAPLLPQLPQAAAHRPFPPGMRTRWTDESPSLARGQRGGGAGPRRSGGISDSRSRRERLQDTASPALAWLALPSLFSLRAESLEQGLW